MEDQVPSSIPPQNSPIPGGITPELLELMKAKAREEAIRATLLQQQQSTTEESPTRSTEYQTPQSEVPANFQIPYAQPSVVYVRRNLTVAELIVVFAIACGLVTGVQAAWNFAVNVLPRIEIRAK